MLRCCRFRPVSLAQECCRFRPVFTVLEINLDQRRGASDDEMRSIAAQAGMDPRGMAGYYTAAAKLLEVRDGGRWVTEVGHERLEGLRSRTGDVQAT